MSYFNLTSDDSSQQGLNNSEMLYSKVQRVYLKSRNNEERQRDLRVNVGLLIGLSPMCRQNLSLHLTDDEDPFFLYSLIINEEDFKNVKSQQGLLVDFDHFPSQFIRLLEQCNTTNDIHGPRFLLILDAECRDNATDPRQTHLKIVETNQFKHLCHLDLKIGCGSDADIKKQMALKIKHLKESILVKEKELSMTSSQLTDAFQRLDLKSHEANDLLGKWNEERNALVTRHMQDVNQEREKLAAAQYDWQTQCEKDKRDIEAKNRVIVASLDSQVARLAAENKTFAEKNSIEESTNRKQLNQMDALRKELANAQHEIVTLKKQNSNLDVDYHEKEKLTNALRTRLSSIEQEFQDKSLLVMKQQEQLRTAKEHNNQLEENLRETENTLQRKQHSLKKVSEELIKANEIISRLQSEIVSVKTKVKCRTNIALEQERLIETKQNELSDAVTKLTRLEQRVSDLEANEAILRESAKEAEAKIEAKDKQIRNNDNVINWLNRQLLNAQNESHSQPSSNMTSTPIFMPCNTKRRVGLEINGKPVSAAGSKVPPLPMASMDVQNKYRLPPATSSVAKPTQEEHKSHLTNNPGLPLNKRAAPPAHYAPASAYFPKPAIS